MSLALLCRNARKLHSIISIKKKPPLPTVWFFNPILHSCFSEDREAKLRASIERIVEKSGLNTPFDEAHQATDKNSRNSLKNYFIAFGLTFACIGGYIVYQLGQPTIGEDGDMVQDEYAHLSSWLQYIYRMLEALDYYKRLIKEPSRDKLLPDVMKYPYYQPPYTLVLELTDVLVHPEWTYETGWRFKKRPGIEYFLESLHGMFEVVVFTAEQGMTVFPILETLDPKNYISYKLVRDSTHFVDGIHVKNLSKLNRDLSKVIVVDWNADSVKFHKENVLHVPRWRGNDDDTTLVDLVSFLQTVSETEISDVREVLKYYSEFENPLHAFRLKQQELLEHMESARATREQKTKKTLFNSLA